MILTLRDNKNGKDQAATLTDLIHGEISLDVADYWQIAMLQPGEQHVLTEFNIVLIRTQ